MTDLKSQKRMAADILDVGENRVWIDPNKQGDVSTAITKQDIKELIEEGAIKAKDKKGISRGRAREKKKSKGTGSRKGSKNSRQSEKKQWMNKVRAQRKVLKQMRDDGKIQNNTYRKIYKRVKGGEVRDINHLQTLIEEMEE